MLLCLSFVLLVYCFILFVPDLNHCRKWGFAGVRRQCDWLSEAQRNSLKTPLIQVFYASFSWCGSTANNKVYINLDYKIWGWTSIFFSVSFGCFLFKQNVHVTHMGLVWPNRKILNDLSSDAPAVPRIEEEKAEEDSSAAAATPAITTVTVPTPIYQTSSGQYSRW